MRRSVVITGGSSGIGRACAQRFAQAGYTVFAASRRAALQVERAGDGCIRPLVMDVCDDASVWAAAAEVIAAVGAPDVLVHCAGMGISGAAEDTPIDAVKAQMDTNYFGVLRVNRALLPAMRQRGRGSVLIVGSVAGVIPIPFQSQYSASKFALEAYAAALRMEIAPYGIGVTIVEPGDTRTSFTDARIDSCPANSCYRDVCLRSVRKMAHDEQKGAAPGACADVVYKMAQKKHPPLRTTVGLMYKLMVFAKRLLPDHLVLWILGKMYMPEK